MKYEYPGRNLRLKVSGPDVRILHDVLIHLGYGIPPEEYSSTTVGQNTKDAVTDIQKKYGHPGLYGVVDQFINPDKKSPNLLMRAFRLGKEVAHGLNDINQLSNNKFLVRVGGI